MRACPKLEPDYANESTRELSSSEMRTTQVIDSSTLSWIPSLETQQSDMAFCVDWRILDQIIRCTHSPMLRSQEPINTLDLELLVFPLQKVHNQVLTMFIVGQLFAPSSHQSWLRPAIIPSYC